MNLNTNPSVNWPTQLTFLFKTKFRRRGTTAVEMAVVSSVLFAVILGGMELMRVTMVRHSAEYASYLGARAGIVTGATAGDVQAAVDAHFANLGIVDAVVTVTPAIITDATTQVQVAVAIPALKNGWVTPNFFLGDITGRSTLLTERSASVMQQSIPTPPPPPPEPEPEPDPNATPEPEPEPEPPSPPPPPPPAI